MGLTEWILIVALIVFVLFAVSVSIDTHKTIKRIEEDEKNE